MLSAPHFGCKRNTYCFQTVFHPDFNKLADIFLDNNGKKIISCFFERNPISPIPLAYWFMDDGGVLSYNKHYVREALVVNAQGFTVNQVKLVSDSLNKAHALNS